MRIIDRYIAKTVLSAIGLVTLMLAGLQLFMLFVGQLDAIGQGNYTVFHALVYVLLQTPFQVYLFFPVACLLGALLGLGMLSNSSELLVVRASGISVFQVTAAVLKVAGILVIVVCGLGESVVPKMIDYAKTQKALYRSGGQTLRTAQGLWLRSKDNFIHISKANSADELQDIYQYQFDNNKQLVLARKINKAKYRNGEWHLSGVSDSLLSENKIETKKHAKMIWQSGVLPQMIAVSSKTPEEMGIGKLWQYIKIQKKAHLEVSSFEISFWRRLFQPLTTCVMLLLAIPFIFGPLRSITMGQRFIVGAVVGFSFHTLNEFSVPIGQLYQVPSLLAAVLPTLFFAFIGVALIRLKKN